MKQYYTTIQEPTKGINLRQYIHDINRYRFNWHREIEITLVLNGKVEFSIEGKTYFLQEDDLLLVNSNMGHASLLRDTSGIAMVLRFDPIIFRSAFEDYTKLDFHCLSVGDQAHQQDFRMIRYYMARMMYTQLENAPYSQLVTEGAFQMLCGILLEKFPPQHLHTDGRGNEMSHRQVIQRMITYIESYYRQKITLDEIAKIAQYNRIYVSTFFKENVGINFYDYLTRTRLRHAIYEMNTTQKTLTQIALDSGFPDLKTFSTNFHKYFEKTPNQYRQSVCDDPVKLNSEEERHYLPIGYGNIKSKLEEYLILPAPHVEIIKTDDGTKAKLDQLRSGVNDIYRQLGTLLQI
ncbi:AraC family transcriptional regulator [Marasmitruncus massiliensis]|uniref:AraC family transcriptional regulator n=1 Tax=Marasmitruncus massiliensis TaxID=1944642 RepID=UPI000C7C8DCE|nr:AraC family transcriptional regulator [Marasmitruncus massiliensis]MBE6904974.1 AraC family transcriptional regulator [Oscillospiraceae bacterium]